MVRQLPGTAAEAASAYMCSRCSQSPGQLCTYIVVPSDQLVTISCCYTTGWRWCWWWGGVFVSVCVCGKGVCRPISGQRVAFTVLLTPPSVQKVCVQGQVLLLLAFCPLVVYSVILCCRRPLYVAPPIGGRALEPMCHCKLCFFASHCRDFQDRK
jgi:hypothetical protein